MTIIKSSGCWTENATISVRKQSTDPAPTSTETQKRQFSRCLLESALKPAPS